MSRKKYDYTIFHIVREYISFQAEKYFIHKSILAIYDILFLNESFFIRLIKESPMRAQEINLQKLLVFAPDEGKLLLNSERMLLFSQHSMSILQRLLIHHFGFEYSRALFSQFGQQCGKDDYNSIAENGNWDSEIDKIASGPVTHMWEGIVHVEPTKIEFDREKDYFHMTGIWKNSYEAENFVKNFGLSSIPVCFSLTGYASGWASNFFGKELVAIETSCIAKGDPHCAFEMKPTQNWDETALPWIRALHATSSSISSILEREVEERTKKLMKINEELAIAKEKAELAAKAKTNFLATMSHEIRTPMNGVIGMAELLSHTNINQEQKEFIDILLTSSELLLNIINDILDFSKLEEGKFEILESDTDIRNCISECCTLFQFKLNEKRLELSQYVDGTIPGYLQLDDKRIRQVLINLIGNAVKFTPEDGEIQINVKMIDSEEGKKLRFSVKDNGIGIPHDKQSKLFSPFTQVDSSTTKNFGGTGLGLAICKKITDLMKGKIWLESSLNVGSIFYFEIPMHTSSKQDPDYLKANNSILKNRNIFVTDDNHTNLFVFKNMLKFWNMNVTCFDSPFKLLDSLKDSQPDIILIDYNMPGMDGINLAKQIRLQHESKIKLILCSSSDLDELKNETTKSIFDAVISKPVKQKNLFEKLVFFYSEKELESPESIKLSSQNRSDQNIKVLLVEDNLINQRLTKKMLDKLEIECDIAENGEIAIEKAIQNHYDLIFMDIHMPVMDGEEASFQIQKKIASPPPIIIMSADVFSQEELKNSKVLIAGFLLKPVKISDLEKILNKFHPSDSAHFEI